MQWIMRLFFASSKEYRILPGDTILVIEVAKEYVKYFKMIKPSPEQLNLVASAPPLIEK